MKIIQIIQSTYYQSLTSLGISFYKGVQKHIQGVEAELRVVKNVQLPKSWEA